MSFVIIMFVLLWIMLMPFMSHTIQVEDICNSHVVVHPLDFSSLCNALANYTIF